jgi:hypothetical protein
MQVAAHAPPQDPVLARARAAERRPVESALLKQTPGVMWARLPVARHGADGSAFMQLKIIVGTIGEGGRSKMWPEMGLSERPVRVGFVMQMKVTFKYIGVFLLAPPQVTQA